MIPPSEGHGIDETMAGAITGVIFIIAMVISVVRL
jgi:hypothetical protein